LVGGETGNGSPGPPRAPGDEAVAAPEASVGTVRAAGFRQEQRQQPVVVARTFSATVPPAWTVNTMSVRECWTVINAMVGKGTCQRPPYLTA